MRLTHNERQRRRKRAVYARVICMEDYIVDTQHGVRKDEDACQQSALRACCR